MRRFPSRAGPPLVIKNGFAGKSVFDLIALLVQENNVPPSVAASERFPKAGIYLTSGLLTGELIRLGISRFVFRRGQRLPGGMDEAA